jgi:hypothetical protein
MSSASSNTAPVEPEQSRFNFSNKKDVETGEKAGEQHPNVSADGTVMQDPLHKKSTSDIATVDAVWGEISEDGPNYRALGWYVPNHKSLVA